MKLIIIAFSFQLIFFACSNLESPTNHPWLGDDQRDSVHVRLSYSYEEFLDSEIKVYADSLNSYVKGAKLPAFLLDPDLDYKSTINNWPNSNFVSLREKIFSRVTNLDLLEVIVADPYFNRPIDVAKRRPLIPSDSLSIHVLATERMAQLKARK